MKSRLVDEYSPVGLSIAEPVRGDIYLAVQSAQAVGPKEIGMALYGPAASRGTLQVQALGPVYAADRNSSLDDGALRRIREENSDYRELGFLFYRVFTDSERPVPNKIDLEGLRNRREYLRQNLYAGVLLTIERVRGLDDVLHLHGFVSQQRFYRDTIGREDEVRALRSGNWSRITFSNVSEHRRTPVRQTVVGHSRGTLVPRLQRREATRYL